VITSVPNVSEGRDATLLAALSAAAGASARVLDVDPGWDAHRVVLTLTGGDLVEANFQLARTAVEHIDLRTHRGVHVRMGAIDVIPFVPMGGEVDECHAMARALSERIAFELKVPVYRYGLGSRDLFAVRRDGFEGLAETMALVPPDYGPLRPHRTAGAVAVGVRDVLIAFNVCLAGEDLKLARHVARQVRASAGGLHGVMALGWHTPSLGCAQVSMNLTDWRRTPPHVVYEAIRALAPVAGSELVGMMPLGALEAAAAYYRTDLAGAARAMGLDRVKPFDLERKVIELAVRR
jgi:glutamate formiminotransferase